MYRFFVGKMPDKRRCSKTTLRILYLVPDFSTLQGRQTVLYASPDIYTVKYFLFHHVNQFLLQDTKYRR